MMSSKDIINKLNLESHPEGGYFKETYRSSETINESCLSKVFKGNRNYSTSIYYLLESGDFSAFHKINQDETWHFYLGSTIELKIINNEGSLSTIYIGNNILNGEVLQYTVPKNEWFAAKIIDSESYSLVGCTVAPGFDFNDFTLANRAALIKDYPQHKAVINAYTRQ